MSRPEPAGTAPKLADIASRIYAHLMRLEKGHKGSKPTRYFMPNAWPAGSRVGVRYVSYQGSWFLTKADALEYLAWLDAGNEGSHHRALSFNTRIRREVPA